MARRRRSGELARLRVLRNRSRPARDRPQRPLELPADLRRRIRLARCTLTDADDRDAARVHRPRRRRCVPHAALQRRRRGTALHRRDHGGGRGPLPRRPGRPVGLRHRGDGRRRLCRRRRVGAHPRHLPGVLPHERDHHVAHAQLRRGDAPHLSHLQLRVVLAGDEGLQRQRLSDRQGATVFVDLAGADDPPAGRNHAAARRRHRSPRRSRALAAVHAHAVRLRGPGARRLPARRALRGRAHAAEDPRRHGDLGRDRRPRRRQPGRRLPAHARRRPQRPPEAALRVLGNRRRGARALQPARGRPRCVPRGRAAERRQHAAGRRLPVRARRRDAGDRPLLGTRRRAARPLSRALRVPHRTRSGGARRVNNSLLVVLIASGIAYGTPLLYAALGELLAERSGVLNLGVEGMMLVGAVMGFWTVQRFHANTGIVLAAAIGVAALAGALMAAIHAFLVITLRASQIVSGLALTIFAGAAGLLSYLGNDLNLADSPARHSFLAIHPFGLQNLPVIGPILFGQTVLVYASWLCVIGVGVYLSRTRLGLNVRAVGEAPASADAMGINVTAYRYAHTLVGGAFAGIAGATFTLAITPQWVSGITGGAGWIAIALVIFAFWRPGLCLVGAYFFGALQALAPQLQARSIQLGPTELWSNSLPYVMTVLVLVA